jgi:hypothetical protein
MLPRPQVVDFRTRRAVEHASDTAVAALMVPVPVDDVIDMPSPFLKPRFLLPVGAAQVASPRRNSSFWPRWGRNQSCLASRAGVAAVIFPALFARSV